MGRDNDDEDDGDDDDDVSMYRTEPEDEVVSVTGF